MSQRHAAEFFKAVQKDQGLQSRLQAMSDPKSFIQVAADRGYSITEEELEGVLIQLSDHELAAITNPGVGARQRLVPR
jgi:predicted ribosomally synthesized peptide with nif11-like leader